MIRHITGIQDNESLLREGTLMAIFQKVSETAVFEAGLNNSNIGPNGGQMVFFFFLVI